MSGALHAIVVHYLGDADGDGRRTGMGNTLEPTRIKNITESFRRSFYFEWCRAVCGVCRLGVGGRRFAGGSLRVHAGARVDVCGGTGVGSKYRSICARIFPLFRALFYCAVPMCPGVDDGQTTGGLDGITCRQRQNHGGMGRRSSLFGQKTDLPLPCCYFRCYL